MKWKAIGFEPQNLEDIPLAAINPFRIIEEDGKIGVEHYFTLQRKVIIPAKYDYIERKGVNTEIFFIVGANKKYGVYNSEGKLIVDVIYDKIYIECENLIVVLKGKYRGAYDFEGNHIVPDKYADIWGHTSFIEVRCYNNKLGAYDYEGNHIMEDNCINLYPACFDDAHKKLLAFQISDGSNGLCDMNGKVIVPAKYTNITLCENFIIADNSSCSVVYDYEGNQILPISTTYRYVNWIGKLILQGTGNGTRVFDKTGKEIEPGMEYEDVFMQHDEFLAVKFKGQWKVLFSV